MNPKNNKLEKLIIDISMFEENFDYYHFHDVYDTYEDAYNDIRRDLLYSKSIYKRIDIISDELKNIAQEKKLKDSSIGKLYNHGIKLIYDLNDYVFSYYNKQDMDF